MLKLFGMPMSQITAIVTVLAAVCVLIYLYMKKKPAGGISVPQELDKTEDTPEGEEHGKDGE